MSAIFKPEHIGQQVSDPRFGNGVIANYKRDIFYPITVDFKDHTGIAYSEDGRCFEGQLPTLQFGPMDNYERKLTPSLQDGQLIVVQVDEENWRIAKVKFNDGQPLFYSYVRDDGSPVYYDMKNITWRCAL